MSRSLLDVVIVYHPDDARVCQPYVDGVARAFEQTRPDADSDLPRVGDPWERTAVCVCCSLNKLDEITQRDETRTLFVVLITDNATRDPDLKEILSVVADSLPAKGFGSRNALVYSFSETASDEVPSKLKKRQIGSIADLGERRVAPHTLAMVALHRARKLLEPKADPIQLTLFISHAKADGVFFAQALKSSIESIPELECWYDAKDIENGTAWYEEIKDAANNCVFVALRTPAYDVRKACRLEFETALLNGVPIVVIDSLLMSPTTAPTHLPFSSMPTVRIPDGNTYRVLIAALREHMRILLMKAIAQERSVDTIGVNYRIWPRLPCIAAFRKEDHLVSAYWLVPHSLAFQVEFSAIRDWLFSLKSQLKLEILEQFQPVPADGSHP